MSTVTVRRRPSSPPSVRVDVSVVIPCLNEAETLAECIQAAKEGIVLSGLVGEVVVADNGSTDGSQAIARRLGARVVDVVDRGYGNALRGGIAAARGRFIVMGDADQSYDFRALAGLVARLVDGYDLVMGNRFRGGIEPGAMPWPNRWIGNPVLSGIGRLFFGSSIGDFHCGLRAFSREAYDRLQLSTGGMEFASEMVVKASLRGLRVADVPVVLRRDGRSRPPHLRRWRDGWRHLRFMLLYSPRWLFLYPGAGLMLIGTSVAGWLLPGGHRVGRFGFDINTLLVAAAMAIVGYQLVIFAVFSKVYATRAGFLPPNPVLTRLYRYVTLEVGLLAGVAMAAAGFVTLAVAGWRWETVGFGELDAGRSMRLVIPAMTLLAVGVETIFASFFLSILGIEHAHETKASDV